MKLCYVVVVLLLPTMGLAACGKSNEQMEREKMARQVAMQKALADSVAEEHEKDRRMRDAAAEQANERIAREAAEHEREVAAKAAVAVQAGPTPEQRQAERDNILRKYTDKFMQTVNDPASAQVRKMELSPKQNGMCAGSTPRPGPAALPVSARRGYRYRVTAEEPRRGTRFTQFLLFRSRLGIPAASPRRGGSAFCSSDNLAKNAARNATRNPAKIRGATRLISSPRRNYDFFIALASALALSYVAFGLGWQPSPWLLRPSYRSAFPPVSFLHCASAASVSPLYLAWRLCNRLPPGLASTSRPS